ncbi:cell division protein [Caulobacter sp. 602-1]|uniref:cell division protein FtsL n=1 Tax=Caulobacter sp. 602-1 TaxID=2492472 RepID=UPI000F62C8AD|nr:cell division protein [Caulobacter sp. 602-1]RRN62076.1 cell division protein [Caulobacter sp. 602-1]
MTSVGLFDRRIRGFRVVEVAGMGVLLTLVTSVYLAKTFAGRERQEIGRIEQEIGDEAVRKRLLEAEVAHLEQPRRIEQLAQMMQLKPIAPDHEITEDALIDVARRRELPRVPISAAPVAPEALAADAPEAVPDDVPPPAPPEAQR